MSSEIVISVKGINKSYNLYKSPQDRLKQALFNKNQYYKEFQALKEITFDVFKGQTVGILGRNGSGKSTLLQIITGTLQPTNGHVYVNGRIAALLELGSGFNPDYTGRENVIMNGAIMGLTHQEILNNMDDIEAFAEIGDFIDRPVNTYSSGMFVRLAFASAIHANPEILIIDEALAVGDLKFQLKCIDKLKELKGRGITILFVSHDVYSVRNFCDHAIWMMDGTIHMRGDVNRVVDSYLDYMKVDKQERSSNNDGIFNSKESLSIEQVSFYDEYMNRTNVFNTGAVVNVVVEYILKKELDGIVGGVALFDKNDTYICGLNTKIDSVSLPTTPGHYQLGLTYDDLNLLPGTYYVDVGFFESTGVVPLDYKKRFHSFRVDSNNYIAEGITFMPHKWRIRGASN